VQSHPPGTARTGRGLTTTMLFQYPGFEIHAFTRLTAEIERLRVIEEGALDRLYRREQRA
jgi:hypothetical protein